MFRNTFCHLQQNQLNIKLWSVEKNMNIIDLFYINNVFIEMHLVSIANRGSLDAYSYTTLYEDDCFFGVNPKSDGNFTALSACVDNRIIPVITDEMSF